MADLKETFIIQMRRENTSILGNIFVLPLLVILLQDYLFSIDFLCNCHGTLGIARVIFLIGPHLDIVECDS